MNCFILTAMRSGSTYLTNMLWDTGCFHYPEAHSDHPSLIPQRKIREFLAPNPHIDPWGKGEKTKEEAVAYLRHKLSLMSQQPCLFKVLMEQYRYYLLDGKDRSLIESMIPNLKYIWLERSDIVARTVSAYIFFHSKVDHCWDQQTYDEYMSRQVHIDAKGLLDVYKNHVKRCNWMEYLQGTDYLKVEYEDLVAKPYEVLGKCVDHLGLEGVDIQRIVDKQPRFKTERPESKAWMDNLRQLLKKGMM